MMASLSENTLKQYNTTFRLWWRFCFQTGISVYEATTEELIRFLHNIFETANLKYGSFNSHRSALSLILEPSVTDNPILNRFMKGLSKLRPAAPRYNATWDPNSLLQYAERLPNPLTLQELSRKLVTLLCLITGHRLQTIAKIKLSNFIYGEDAIQILIADPIKTSGRNQLQPTLHIPFFKEKRFLCCASALTEYIDRISCLRHGQDTLFLSYRRPHLVASKQTLSRWVKEFLQAAGIDTSVFKAHSTRHSSTSAALRNGIAVDVICKTAGWSQRTATFAKFYNRPLVPPNEFARAVCNVSHSRHADLP